MKKILLGNEAIVKGALVAGVNFVSGYPGCPSAEIGETFAKIAKEEGVYCEWSTTEKTALEAAIGASFSGLRSLVHMKSFGINVCSDSLYPLAYTGVKAGMVIVVADDPSCWSSAQSEQNSRGYAYLSHIPVLEPADVQECYDFTKLGFEISEKFNIPVILRTVTRVNHQRSIAEYQTVKNVAKVGEFVKNPYQFCTMPPRVLEMKRELLEKIEKIKQFADRSKINFVEGKKSNVGIIASGVAYLYVKEALLEMGLELPVLKLGFFYPLAEKKIKDFVQGLKKVLVVEELDGYLEKEIKALNLKAEIIGKELLSEIGELNSLKVAEAIAKITGKKLEAKKFSSKIEVPRRYPRFCLDCPHFYSLAAIKRAAPEGTIFGGDIGCYMLAGYPPHNMQDYLFDMGASMGISHGISKATCGKQKIISLIGDGTFFHSGMQGLMNAVYNKSNCLFVILDNRITAMTGHQPNPGMGKNAVADEAEELKIEEIVKSFGVKNIKVLDPIDMKALELSVKEFLSKPGVSVIICRRICALLAKRQKNAQSNE